MSVIPYIRFLVHCRIRCAVRQNESQHVAIHAASEREFGWVNPEMTSLGQGDAKCPGAQGCTEDGKHMAKHCHHAALAMTRWLVSGVVTCTHTTESVLDLSGPGLPTKHAGYQLQNVRDQSVVLLATE